MTTSHHIVAKLTRDDAGKLSTTADALKVSGSLETAVHRLDPHAGDLFAVWITTGGRPNPVEAVQHIAANGTPNELHVYVGGTLYELAHWQLRHVELHGAPAVTDPVTPAGLCTYGFQYPDKRRDCHDDATRVVRCIPTVGTRTSDTHLCDDHAEHMLKITGYTDVTAH